MICHNFGSRVDLIQNCGGDTICFPWGRGDLLPGFGGRKGGPCMTHHRPGIDIPVATEETILHAAAFLEFKRHVERLIREGQPVAAYLCWMQAVEVLHSPFMGPTTSDVAELPPSVRMLCCDPACARCAVHQGGFKFPWLG